MSATRPATTRAGTVAPDVPHRTGWIGVGAVLVLMAVAAAIPPLTGLDVHNETFAPLRAYFAPVLGPRSITHSALGSDDAPFGLTGLILAVVVAVAAIRYAPRLADRLAWSRLLVVCYLGGLAWMTSLAAIRGRRGLRGPLGAKDEYLPTARNVDNVSQFMHDFTSKINSNGGNWPIHVASHPPGMTLFFVGLVRAHLGGRLAAGLTVTVLAATVPLAVLITLRRLGQEPAARRVAPLLVVGPAAIWSAVSADAVVATVLVWALATLTIAATSVAARGRAVAGTGAGLLFAGCLYLSYGMAVAGLLAVAVLLAARSRGARAWGAVPWAVLGAVVVVVGFTAAGFSWWRAYPVLRDRYYAGAASLRPTGYWIWANFAAFGFSAGPVAGAAVAATVTRLRDRAARPLVLLSGASLLCLVAADLSLMSKAEVERIWLPFVPWLLVSCALLPARWRQRALVIQALGAVVIEGLLHTYW